MDAYRAHFENDPDLVEAAKKELKGKHLGCFHPLSVCCHVDILLAVINR